MLANTKPHSGKLVTQPNKRNPHWLFTQRVPQPPTKPRHISHPRMTQSQRERFDALPLSYQDTQAPRKRSRNRKPTVKEGVNGGVVSMVEQCFLNSMNWTSVRAERTTSRSQFWVQALLSITMSCNAQHWPSSPHTKQSTALFSYVLVPAQLQKETKPGLRRSKWATQAQIPKTWSHDEIGSKGVDWVIPPANPGNRHVTRGVKEFSEVLAVGAISLWVRWLYISRKTLWILDTIEACSS